jgi:hypothetical protein
MTTPETVTQSPTLLPCKECGHWFQINEFAEWMDEQLGFPRNQLCLLCAGKKPIAALLKPVTGRFAVKVWPLPQLN